MAEVVRGGLLAVPRGQYEAARALGFPYWRMDLDHDACYRALVHRDARFDGRFFTGVKTTGIYCRPVCPARTPLSRNVVFFPTAAAAQEAGFRPCLRCRPETAPDMALPTREMPMPVLPAVPSTMMPPGLSSPRFTASWMMNNAARSLTD